MIKGLIKFWRKLRLCSFVLFGDVFTCEKRDVFRIVYKYAELRMNDYDKNKFVVGRTPCESLELFKHLTDICMREDTSTADYNRYITVLAREILNRELHERELL